MNQSVITLNPEQQIAVQALLNFIQDPDPTSPFFVLSGFAGTGKTFCMREVLSKLSQSRLNFSFTAPTNKAAKVLRAITGEASTIYSLLGLRIDKSGELKQVIAGKPPEALADLDIIFVDEGSMVNKNLMTVLKASIERYNLRVVFMADSAQLPPVGEAHSPIWDLEIGASLTQVMRHDNQILDLVTEIRQIVTSPAPCITIKSHHDADGGVWKLPKAAFKEQIFKAAVAGEFADGSDSKILAWRNVKVAEYNGIVRHALWGAEAQSTPYMVGERLVATAPCQRGDEMLLTTDEETLVEGVINCKHPLNPRYNAIELKAVNESGKTVRLLVLHPSSKEQFDSDCQALAHEAAAMPRMWKKFWELKELFHEVQYGYAITTHRSQGSTYTNVWVDYQDILLNRNRKEAFQCLYVACSRPTTRLYLA